MFVIYPLYTKITHNNQMLRNEYIINYCFNFIVFYILSSIMEAEPKIFLNLLQFITITFTIYDACLYCILCYQFISDSTSKFLIFTSKCSCPSIWNILFQSISYGLKSSYTSKSRVTLYFLFVT